MIIAILKSRYLWIGTIFFNSVKSFELTTTASTVPGQGRDLHFSKTELYWISRYRRSWGPQNFLRNQKILFQSEDITISKSRLSHVSITKTSNKSNYLKISFFDFKTYLLPQFSSNCLETFQGYSVGPYKKKTSALFFFFPSAGRSIHNYVIFSKNLKKST